MRANIRPVQRPFEFRTWWLLYLTYISCIRRILINSIQIMFILIPWTIINAIFVFILTDDHIISWIKCLFLYLLAFICIPFFLIILDMIGFLMVDFWWFISIVYNFKSTITVTWWSNLLVLLIYHCPPELFWFLRLLLIILQNVLSFHKLL